MRMAIALQCGGGLSLILLVLRKQRWWEDVRGAAREADPLDPIPGSDSQIDLPRKCEKGALSGTWLSMDTLLRAVEQAVRICHALKRPFGRNLLVCRPQQPTDPLAIGEVFLQEISQKGMVLYECTDHV